MTSLCRPQVLLAAFFALTVLPCQARLGETLDQCIARYGQPISAKDMPDALGVGEKEAIFQKSGYTIVVSFLKGSAGAEEFVKQGGSDLSDTERDIILQADSARGKWIKSEKSGIEEIWVREDGAVALHNATKHYLVLETKECVTALKAKIATDAKNKLKDF